MPGDAASAGQDLNNVIEADYGKLKQLIRPVGGFKTLKTVSARIESFELVLVLRQGHASAFNLTRGIRGKARIAERAFGLGASALAEAVQFISERLEHEATSQLRRPDLAPSSTPGARIATEPESDHGRLRWNSPR